MLRLRLLESFSVNKIFVERPSLEPKVRVLMPMYEPLQISKCRNCGKVIAEPKELIRIQKSSLRRKL
jgi:hypothetical protein